jgi:hypothetical protein
MHFEKSESTSLLEIILKRCWPLEECVADVVGDDLEAGIRGVGRDLRTRGTPVRSTLTLSIFIIMVVLLVRGSRFSRMSATFSFS